jgi:hypothetical protein
MRTGELKVKEYKQSIICELDTTQIWYLYFLYVP